MTLAGLMISKTLRKGLLTVVYKHSIIQNLSGIYFSGTNVRELKMTIKKSVLSAFNNLIANIACNPFESQQ